MNVYDFIASEVRRVRQFAEDLVQGVVFFTKISATSADGSTDGVEGWPTGDAPQPQQTARRMEPWGLHGRPKTGVQALIARVMGGAASNLIAGIWTGGYGRQSLNEGETQLYNGVDGCEVFLDKDGVINIKTPVGAPVKIDAGTAASVIINGGSADVARIATDTAGPYPIVGQAPSRLKTSIT